MLNRLPRQMPALDVMLCDIGNPTAPQVAHALGVSERTVRRWLREDAAPRPAMLALFWITRWGLSAIDCEAFNTASMHRGLAAALKDEIGRLQTRLDRLGRIGDFGAANDPAPGVSLRQPTPAAAAQDRRPQPVRTDKQRSTTKPEPGSTEQPRGFQRG